MKIALILDDSPTVLQILEDELKGTVDVVSFLDPKKAAIYLKDNDVDIVFTDYHMPTMSGADFLRYIKKKNLVKKFTPMILVSSEDSVELLKNARDCGAMTTLKKPFKPGKVRMILKIALGI